MAGQVGSRVGELGETGETCKGGGPALASDVLQVDGQARRVHLVIESGVRIHTSRYTHAAPPQPSPFVAKLRKHVRGQRLTDVRLVPGDRLLCLSFGTANWTHHVLVEFYAGGNIILCDEGMTCLSVLRPYTGGDGTRVAPKQPYPLHRDSFSTFRAMDREKLTRCLAAAVAQCAGMRTEAGGERQESSKMRRQMGLARLLAAQAGYAPALVEHALLRAGWMPHVAADDPQAAVLSKTAQPAPQAAPGSDNACMHLGPGGAPTPPRPGSLEALLASFSGIDHLLCGNTAAGGFDADEASACSQRSGGREAGAAVGSGRGFIMLAATEGKGGGDVSLPAAACLLPQMPQMVDVAPLVLEQQGGQEAWEYPSLDVALDEYFTRLDKQKGDKATVDQEAGLALGVAKVASDIDARAQGLAEMGRSLEEGAEQVVMHADEVEEALELVRRLLARHRDWEAVEKATAAAREQGVQGSRLIERLKLGEHLIVLRLPRRDAQAHEAQEGDASIGLEERQGTIESPAGDASLPDARAECAQAAAQEDAACHHAEAGEHKKSKGKGGARAPLIKEDGSGSEGRQVAGDRGRLDGVMVELDLRLTCMANVRLLFDRKKKVAAKQQRTQDARRLSLQRTLSKLGRQQVAVSLPPSFLQLATCTILLATCATAPHPRAIALPERRPAPSPRL